jgi:hypothetical protein
MTDTDRLAVLLRTTISHGVAFSDDDYEWVAARLIAAGVTLAATPAPLDCGHDLVGIRLRGYREGRAEALGDVREFVDESHDRAVAIIGSTS